MAGNNRKLVILQDRDIHLLRELAVMRVIDRKQAEIVAGFGSTTRANARLLALVNAGYLRRFFWGGVGVARKALYAASPRGADIVGMPDRGPRRARGQVLAADFFSMHQLLINEIYCLLYYRPLPVGAKFIRWIAFHEPIQGTSLIPDGYAEMEAESKKHAFFIEADRGTENRAAWQQKVEAYLSYAASGSFAGRFGLQQFRVLVIANSESRISSISTATAALTTKIFRFTTFDRINRDGIWTPVWQKPNGSERLPLLTLPS